MLLAMLFLALLFVAGLLATLFYPSLVHYFSPRKPIEASPAASSSASETRKKKRMTSKDDVNKEELRRVFATFDKNGDGFITRQELRESLRNMRIVMSEKEINEIVVKFDSNGDGLIDFDEFCLLIEECMGSDGEADGEDQKEGAEEQDEENLKEAFGVFDSNKDGLISVEELALVLTSLGLREGKKMEDCKEMIKKVDMDGDGMVDFQEFKTMMKSRKLVLAS
ncbi:calmodulin-like protein 7 [Neltuma alba]|uniref:calmodulin-like protein 7 n=1 Tax=Neltuma alba TaxID=207710 RepID=UPI0010A55C09|nr:calmodulin-like protein 7 [Prosopis alba]